MLPLERSPVQSKAWPVLLAIPAVLTVVLLGNVLADDDRPQVFGPPQVQPAEPEEPTAPPPVLPTLALPTKLPPLKGLPVQPPLSEADEKEEADAEPALPQTATLRDGLLALGVEAVTPALVARAYREAIDSMAARLHEQALRIEREGLDPGDTVAAARWALLTEESQKLKDRFGDVTFDDATRQELERHALERLLPAFERVEQAVAYRTGQTGEGEPMPQAQVEQEVLAEDTVEYVHLDPPPEVPDPEVIY